MSVLLVRGAAEILFWEKQLSNTVHHIQWSMRHNESINLSLFIYQTCRCTNSVVKSKFVLFAFDVEFVFVKRYHLLMWPNDFKSKNLLGFHGTLIFGTLDGPQLPTKILICSIVWFSSTWNIYWLKKNVQIQFSLNPHAIVWFFCFQ